MGYLERNFRETEELNRRTILAAAEPRPGSTLVDLGCGDGEFTMRVAQRAGAARVIGVELIEAMAAAARARDIEVIGADLGQPLPFESASIDVVHSNQVIEHLAGTDLFLSEIGRILKPGGYAIVSTNNLASWHNVFSLAMGWQPAVAHVSDEVITGNPLNFAEGHAGSRGQMHLRVFTGRSLAGLARFHGLDVELEQTAGYYPLPPALARLAVRADPRHGAFLVQRYRSASTAPDGT